MFSNTSAHEPFQAATTVVWSEVVVGDRRRPVKIVGIPAFGRPTAPPPRRMASRVATQSRHQRKESELSEQVTQTEYAAPIAARGGRS